MSETKTSEEWEKEADFTVQDPDGWDRANLLFSWFSEQITQDEFYSRAMRSTIYAKGRKQ